MAVTLGATFTAYFQRTMTIDSTDPQAQADYDELIETLPETKMSIRPMPEATLAIGYAW